MHIVVPDPDGEGLANVRNVLESQLVTTHGIVSAKINMFLTLLGFLHDQGDEPEIAGILYDTELHLIASHRYKTDVTMRVDTYDYSPLKNGLPQLHYRVSIREHGEVLSRDLRTHDVGRVHRALAEIFNSNN